MTVRLLAPAAFLALTLSPLASAQDKPVPLDDKQADKPAAPAAPSGKSEADWERDLHTTDCSKMPSRVLFTECNDRHAETRILPLNNVDSQNDANEILVAVRNIADPSTKIFLVTDQNAIVVRAYPQQLDALATLVRTLDQPHAKYKLTCTITETDSGKRVGVQHFSMEATAGQRSSFKQGSKIPVATSSTKEPGGDTQFQYIDIGLNFDATLSLVGNHLDLKVKVEQSSLGEPQTIAGVTEPVIRQGVFEGTVNNLIPGTPAKLSSVDVANSTQHFDVEVLAEKE